MKIEKQMKGGKEDLNKSDYIDRDKKESEMVEKRGKKTKSGKGTKTTRTTRSKHGGSVKRRKSRR